MRGSPVLRGLAVIAALLLLLIPIRCITAPRPAVAAPAPAPQDAAEEIQLTLTSSAAPFTFSVSHLGKVIWSGNSDAASAEKSVSLPFPPEGIDLVLDAGWETKGPAAVKLEVRRNDEDASSQTVWGDDGAASDVLTFH